MKVTKEEVEKAKAASDAAVSAADAALFSAEAAWKKYIKLKEEFENGN